MPIPGTPGSPEFLAAYNAAIAGSVMAEAVPKKREPSPEGWTNIYVTFAVGTKYAKVKIGLAKNPIRRAKELQTGAGAQLRVYDACPVRAWIAKALEAKVHSDLAAYRIRGEWFSVSPQEALRVILRNIEERSQPIHA